jgi:hypothetical protein
MGIQEDLITALRECSAWTRAAFLLTYDEHGGYFDHVAPPQLDAFGLGIRVPIWVVSPLAKRAHVEPTVYEHTSILKFLERLFDLPTLASVNHLFDGGQGVGFTPYSPQTTRSKNACESSCGVKVQWPYPPAYPGTERWTSRSASPMAATSWP